MDKRLLYIGGALLVGLLINTVIFWGYARFLSPLVPVFVVVLVITLIPNRRR